MFGTCPPVDGKAKEEKLAREIEGEKEVEREGR